MREASPPPKSNRCKVEGSLSGTVHLSFTPAQLRALADKAEKLIEDCPSIRVPETYFQLESHLVTDRGCNINVRLFASW